MRAIKENLPIVIITLLTVISFLVIIVLAGKSEQTSLSKQEVPLDILINATTHIRGESSASAVLVEFSDFQCPACAAFYPVLKDFEAKYTGKLKVAYKHFPLLQHVYARKAAEAAETAGAQGKFWEMHDKLFESQDELKSLSLNDATTKFKEYAKELGLNTEQFNTDLDSGKYANLVQSDIDLANKITVNSTPTFYLNGKLLVLGNITNLETAIKAVIN